MEPTRTRGVQLINALQLESAGLWHAVTMGGEHGRYIYASDRQSRCIKAFDIFSGEICFEFGGPESEPLGEPVGLCAAAGLLYVVDWGSGTVKAFDAKGAFVRAYGSPGSGASQLYAPAAVAVSEGEVFVASRGSSSVQVFDAGSGAHRRTFGGRGSGDGLLHEPRAIAAAGGGLLLVADTGNHRIVCFSAEGKFLSAWGRKGTAAGEFLEPQGVAAAGDIAFVSECSGERVQFFSIPDGTPLGSFALDPACCGGPISADPGGRVLLTDRDHGCIHVLSLEFAPRPDGAAAPWVPSADEQFDLALSYAPTDEALMRTLQRTLANRTIGSAGRRLRVCPERQHLLDHARVEGIVRSGLIVSLISEASVAQLAQLNPADGKDWCEVFLLETLLALDLCRVGKLRAIQLILIGGLDADGTITSFESGLAPASAAAATSPAKSPPAHRGAPTGSSGAGSSGVGTSGAGSSGAGSSGAGSSGAGSSGAGSSGVGSESAGFVLPTREMTGMDLASAAADRLSPQVP